MGIKELLKIRAEEQAVFTLGRGAERARVVGIVLRVYGEAKSAGELAIADAIDRLATEIEHG